MKYMGAITNDYDLTNKKYVDGRTPYTIIDSSSATARDEIAAAETAGTPFYLKYGEYLYEYGGTGYDMDEDCYYYSFSVLTAVPDSYPYSLAYLKRVIVWDDDPGTVESLADSTFYGDANTDTKVTQTNTTTNSDYRVLLAGGVNDTTGTTTSYKSTALRFNPSTKILYVSTGTTTGNIYMGLATSDSLYTAIDNLGWTSTVIV